MHREIGNMIDEALDSVFPDFHANVTDPCWAYLVWTGMFENRVRDAVACRLTGNLALTGDYVCREYGWRDVRRVDLAVADGSGEPIALVEFKQMYTYDFLGEQGKRARTARSLPASSCQGVSSLPRPRSFYARVVRDACKLTQGNTASAELYVVLIAAHLDIDWATHSAWHHQDWYLKYATEVQKVHGRSGARATIVLNDWHDDIEKWPAHVGSNETTILTWFESPHMRRIDRWKSQGDSWATLRRIGNHGADVYVTWRIWRVWAPSSSGLGVES